MFFALVIVVQRKFCDHTFLNVLIITRQLGGSKADPSELRSSWVNEWVSQHQLPEQLDNTNEGGKYCLDSGETRPNQTSLKALHRFAQAKKSRTVRKELMKPCLIKATIRSSTGRGKSYNCICNKKALKPIVLFFYF